MTSCSSTILKQSIIFLLIFKASLLYVWFPHKYGSVSGSSISGPLVYLFILSHSSWVTRTLWLWLVFVLEKNKEEIWENVREGWKSSTRLCERGSFLSRRQDGEAGSIRRRGSCCRRKGTEALLLQVTKTCKELYSKLCGGMERCYSKCGKS